MGEEESRKGLCARVCASASISEQMDFLCFFFGSFSSIFYCPVLVTFIFELFLRCLFIF